MSDAKINNQAALPALVERSLDHAKKLGASDAEISVTTSDGFSVNVRCQDIDTVEYHQGKEFGISVFLGKKTAGGSTNDLSWNSVKETIEKAVNIAQHTDADPCAGLPDADLLAYNYPDLDLFHPWRIEVKDAIALAMECEKIGFAADKRIANSEGASLSTGEARHIYGNTLGFIGSYPTTFHSLSCVLIAGSGDSMQRDYSYGNARDPKDLQTVEQIARDAASRTVRRLNAKSLSTQNCPVIFSADVAKSLLASFISAIGGYNLYRKSTFLLDALGEKIFAENIFIEEKPHLPKALGSAPFDAEGVRTNGRLIVNEGILESYILDTYSGRKLKMPTTGNAGGVHNLFIKASDKDLSGLIKLMGKGLLVTELMGQEANVVTGDYSQAAFGFWVENGVIAYPVEGITIAGNLRDMFLKIVAVGNDIDCRGNINTGSIMISDMMVSGE